MLTINQEILKHLINNQTVQVLRLPKEELKKEYPIFYKGTRVSKTL